jgi:DNA polymerase-3 subunit beta
MHDTLILEENQPVNTNSFIAFSLPRASLLKSLARVQAIAARKSTILVLSHVYLEASNNQLTLIATDLDMSIRETISCVVVQEGIVTTPVHTLFDIIRKLDDQTEINIATNEDGNLLNITSGSSSFNLPIIAANEFPQMESDQYDCQFQLPAVIWRTMLQKTKIAMSNEETRYFLNGVYCHIDHNTNSFNTVALDGHRLSLTTIAAPANATNMPGIIIGRKMIQEMLRLIDATEGVITLSVSQRQVKAEVKEVELIAKVIDGIYPDYIQVFKDKQPIQLSIDRDQLASAVDRVATIIIDRLQPVRCQVTHNNLILTAMNNQSGSAKETLPIHYQGDDLVIGFNARYLLDITQAMSCSTIDCTMSSSVSPIVMTEEVIEQDQPNIHATYVLMPLRG